MGAGRRVSGAAVARPVVALHRLVGGVELGEVDPVVRPHPPRQVGLSQAGGLDAPEAVGDVPDPVGLAELAVARHVDTGVHLVADHPGDGIGELAPERVLVV